MFHLKKLRIMKKYLFLLPLAALAMAACSSEELVETGAQASDNNALQIRTAMGDVTRGVVWNDGNFAKFHLSTSGTFIQAASDDAAKASTDAGAVIDADVNKTSGKWVIGGLTDTNNYYWKSKKDVSTFSAYAPVDVKPNVDYTADYNDLSKLQDIVVAFNSGTGSDFSSGVPLYFRHITSQIIIKADNTATDKVEINVKGIRLNHIRSVGKYATPTASTVEAMPSYTVWSNVTNEQNYVVSTSSRKLTGAAAEISGSNPILLIPQPLNQMQTTQNGNEYTTTGQFISVLVNIKNIQTGAAVDKVAVYPKGESYDANKYAWAAVDINGSWEPGKKYIYTLHFTDGGYGKVDADQGDGGTSNPGGGEADPGDDVEDSPVKLTLDVKVVDWEEVTEAQNM